MGRGKPGQEMALSLERAPGLQIRGLPKDSPVEGISLGGGAGFGGHLQSCYFEAHVGVLG